MADTKLEIKVGAVTFTGEGAESWLAQQLDKVLDRLPELLEVRTPDSGGSDESETSDRDSTKKKSGKKVPLAMFLKEKNATGIRFANSFCVTSAAVPIATLPTSTPV
ncbi:MAG TPA: hypothetical protein VK578_00890 [Edaphobacter sp.]|nr:hypothetical protein [Edaphobacter sp.]